MPIKQRESCSLEERGSHIKYLTKTPVYDFLKPHFKNCVISTGKIESCNNVGKTKTIWHDLGGILSEREYGTSTFLVEQVIPVLKKPQCNDKNENLKKIKEYIQFIPDPNFEIKITLLENNNQILICDGNKRAVAWYEHFSKCGINNVNLPVYIITI
jgi:hypothetical protein